MVPPWRVAWWAGPPGSWPSVSAPSRTRSSVGSRRESAQACGEWAGGTAQRIDLDPRIVGDRGDPQGLGHRSRLEARVFQVGLFGLLDLRPRSRRVRWIVRAAGKPPPHRPVGADAHDLPDL